MKTIDRFILYITFIMVLMLVLSDAMAQDPDVSGWSSESTLKEGRHPVQKDTVWVDPSGWISVEDRLPSEKGKYLVYIRRCDDKHRDDCSEFMQAVFYDKPGINSHTYWLTWYMQYDEYIKYTVKVTHWMPLPNPPEK